MTNQKQQFGQFFTKKSDYILKGFEKFVVNKNVTDPFAGSGDLINWARKNKCKKIIGYDNDRKYVNNKDIFYNDSINNKKKYEFVLTNPPYLHKNKATREIKNKYFQGRDFEDLYQISINSIMDSEEGIVIVPLNFLSAKNSRKIRKIFFSKFKIEKLNIFTEQVFPDTTYNVISFYYQRNGKEDKNIIDATTFPEKKKIKIILEKKYDWQIGGNLFKKIENTKNELGIFRLTEDDIPKKGGVKVKLAYNNIKNVQEFMVNNDFLDLISKNIILLRAIDSKNGKKIQLEDIRKYKISALVGKATSRNMAYIIFKTNLTIKSQLKLIELFNRELNFIRKKYSSLFLTNFRDNNRKRISFEFAYKLINYVYQNYFNKDKQLSITL